MRKIAFVVLIILLICISCSNDPATDSIINNQSSDSDWIRNINWQGESASFPQNPKEGYAFYNTSDGYSYIYIAKQGWTPIAKSGLGINWLGEKKDFPTSAKYGDAFFNTLQGSSYIYDGTKWQMLARSGANGSSVSTGISTAKLQVTIDDVVCSAWKIEYNPDKELETKTVTVKNVGSETIYFSDEGAVVTNSYSGYTANNYFNYYDVSAYADVSDVPLSLDPGCSFSITVSYNPSKYVSLYIYLYNTTLHNPLAITFTQSTNTNASSTGNIQKQYLYLTVSMYSPSFHHSLSSKSFTLDEGTQTTIEQLDFNVCEADSNGQSARIDITTSSINDAVFFIGDPFIWIDGENAEDFSIDASPQKNLKLTKGESYSASIVFSPKSIGEKTATLHISTGFAGHEDIQIPLIGKCETIANYYDAYGYAPIDYSTHSFQYLVDDAQGGCYLITTENSTTYIYHVDLIGKCSLVTTLGYSSVRYADYSDGKLNVYVYYSSQYKKIAIDPSTYKTTTTTTYDSTISNLKKKTINGTSYDYKCSYGDYVLGINESTYDCKLDVFNDKEELLASVITVNPGSELVDRVCVSGDYLYFFKKPYCLRRIPLDELIEELKVKFEI